MAISKSLRLAVFFLAFLTAILFGFSFPEKESPKTDKGIAIVELFTSQGCSSCPAADTNLSAIIDENMDQNVFGLSFHVNYWNYLGWKDPYSKEAYTERQREYGSQFRNSTIYTPQMVVNGTYEFVGSNKSLSREVIQKALRVEPKQSIELEANFSNGEITLTYDIQGDIKNSILNVALVERDLKNKILRGENRSKTLHHDNVVRFFSTIKTTKGGKVQIPVPKEFDLSKGKVIAYVQNKTALSISGASATAITK